MPLNRKASILFLISFALYIGLSFVVGLALPKDGSDDLLFLLSSVAVSVPAFLIPAVVFRRKNRFPFAPMPRFSHILLAVIIGVGCIIMNVALSNLTNALYFGIEVDSNSTSSDTIMNLASWNMVLSLAIIPPLSEEFIMRGALLESWRRYSPFGAAIITALLFALLHLAPSYFLVYLGIGLLLACVYLITRNVWLTVIIHFVNNLATVLAALSMKSSGLDPTAVAESPDAADVFANLMGSATGYVFLGLIYGAVAAAIIVPAVLGLKRSCQRYGLGKYSAGGDAFLPRKESKDPLAELYYDDQPTDEAVIKGETDEGGKPSMWKDAVLWIALAILIILNVVAGLQEFGVIGD
ncbi:MAG: CPBP family intramembrane metalloprotease [Clostridiales bacterium]|nr:CPBP family intramembrane metalloprotease [Clostridiales bacterium]